jgi:hypothetical protein
MRLNIYKYSAGYNLHRFVGDTAKATEALAAGALAANFIGS